MRLRIRTLKPEFFEDEKVNAVSRDARYLTIGLITRADDRGRQQNHPPALLGHVYPTGDVSVKQVERWLREIIEIEIAWVYEHGRCSYLWLPRFWRHQLINRPSESDLPGHPDDPYRSMPVKAAIKAFRERDGRESSGRDTGSVSEDSLNSQGGLTPPRAGARSAPFPSSSDEASKEDKAKTDARAVNQDEWPAGMAPELRTAAECASSRLLAVQSLRGGNVPTKRGVGLAVLAHPDRDHDEVAAELEHWALAGRGQNRPVKDWARTYRTFLANSPPSSPSKVVKPDVKSWRRPGEAMIQKALIGGAG